MQLNRAFASIPTILTAVLILSILSPAYGWNPPTADLSGTNSSSNSYRNNQRQNRFDILGTSTINGIQVGEDSDSIAFLIKLEQGDRSTTRFTVSGMSSGDQYEIYFRISEKDFCMLFRASGPSRGTCTFFERNGSSWTSRASLTVNVIVSGGLYNTVGNEIGFILMDATSTSYGFVKFIIGKQFLHNLGARGDLVENIYATSRSGAAGTPGTGTRMDRCPASGYASWTLTGGIPELPAGILMLIFPLIAIYAYVKRSRGLTIYGFKKS